MEFDRFQAIDSGDSPLANETNSKTNLIDVQHVGVTAKIRTPLKRVLPECSSAETDNITDLFKKTDKKTYNKLTGDDSESTATVLTTPPHDRASTTSTSESPKLLYEMHAEQQKLPSKYSAELRKLYNKSTKRLKNCKCQRARAVKRRASNIAGSASASREQRVTRRPPLFERLRSSLKEMCASKAPILSTPYPETTPPSLSQQPSSARTGPQICGVYTFEHGCADFLRATDSPPHVLSNVLAERATYFATRFWAEFFGSLHIGVSFFVTFLLQTYRFMLYSLINTLLVGVLQMTSDYFLKPILTVAFNGFLQPPLIFLYNILTSFRDLLEPIAETLNNFMKPLATVGRSFRLVEATYTRKKFVKDV